MTLKSDPTYRSWEAMKRRCTSTNCSRYADYGGRGITVCKRWMRFENFLADMGERPPGLTLERIRNSGSYCKSNCRWATYKEQALNRRARSDRPRHRGKTVKEWAQVWGVCYSTAWKRLYRTDRRNLTSNTRRA